jgi:hypothetical protein
MCYCCIPLPLLSIACVLYLPFCISDVVYVLSLTGYNFMCYIPGLIFLFYSPLFSSGCFLVNEAGTRHNLGEFKAYLPSTVSRKAYDIANMMPSILQLDMLPRMNDWPKTFETIRPIHQDIGLFFISKNFDGYRYLLA